MSLSLAEIRRRRGSLAERAASQRATIGEILDSQREVIHLADAGWSLARYVAARKYLLMVAALAFAVVQPRRAWRWGIRVWRVFRLTRKARRLLVG